ncbi:hypothetical protein JXL21_14415 [Candidatus Bathyarchaeota archaeon]|nr:hypothetical protein [Candidatus Bathyarchaeota archaeon]
MSPAPDIVLFTAPLCPKCVVVKRRLAEVAKEMPDLAVEELSIFTNLGLAMKHGFLTVPAMLVRGKPLRGVVSKQAILDALNSV